MTESKRPILWHQGLFLQPQHFQQFDLYLQSLLTPFRQNYLPFFWGVSKIQIQESSLQNRMFEVSQGEVFFQDGTWTVFPGNAVVQSRSFENIELELEGEKPFRVYLGCQKLNPAAKNVTSTKDVEDLYAAGTRFISPIEPEDVKDLYFGGSSAQTRYMSYLLKFFWETEVEQLGDYWLIPIAQLELEGDHVRLSRNFVPPTVCVSGSETLMEILKNIQEQILSRSRILEMYKIFRGVGSSDVEPVSLRYLLALSVINRYMPLIQHLEESPVRMHPWVVYGILRQLIGELSTFTERINALGRLADGTELLPAYNHSELGPCFSEAQKLIGELLSVIVVGEENIVHLIREDSYFKGTIPAEAFSDRNIYYLAINAAGDSETIVNTLLHHAKVGSVEEISKLLARALPGIPLERKLTPPPGLPKRPDSYYFNLDSNHPMWVDIRRTGNICLYWDEAPEDANGELIISRA
jgi:type VI secretion system protein ImpJ